MELVKRPMSLRTAFIVGVSVTAGLLVGSAALLVALHLHDGEAGFD